MENRTEAILDRFAESWIETAQYFDDLINNYPGFERLITIRNFIANLKQKGEDRFFRIGNGMHQLIFSRSVNHGLRLDQKYLVVEAYDLKFEITFRSGEKVYRQYMVDDLNDERVAKLLNTLKDTLID